MKKRHYYELPNGARMRGWVIRSLPKRWWEFWKPGKETVDMIFSDGKWTIPDATER